MSGIHARWNLCGSKKPKFWEFVLAVSRNECILRELNFAVEKESVYFNLTGINDTKIIFFVEHYSFALKSHLFDSSYLTQALL